MEVRQLGGGDEEQLETFLRAHRDTSMFLRSNSRRFGLIDRGEQLQGTYVAAFRDGAIVGVLAHSRRGMLLVQAPEGAGELAARCIELSGRKVTGISGPLEQVRRVRTSLGFDDAPVKKAADERLLALDLADLVVPSVPVGRSIVCRAPLPQERDVLCQWRAAYDVETLGADDSEETLRNASMFLDRQIADKVAWVAEEGGTLLSLSAFNAALPDIVQLGGIYTPPTLRGRGYARLVIGVSLVAARDRGASRAVLFTENPSALRCYEALGFRQTGMYGLVLFR
jgi:uncharacterized protein